MPSDEPSRHYNWRLKSLAKLKYNNTPLKTNNTSIYSVQKLNYSGQATRRLPEERPSLVIVALLWGLSSLKIELPFESNTALSNKGQGIITGITTNRYDNRFVGRVENSSIIIPSR